MNCQIIDTHQHLWDPDRLDIPWLDEIPELNRAFLMPDYLRMTAAPDADHPGYAIEKTVYMEIDVAESDIPKEIDLVNRLCDDPKNPLVGMIAAVRPGTDAFAHQLEAAQASPTILGFRRVLHTDETPAGFCLQESFVRDIQKLSGTSLTFDICIRREELPDAASLIRQCPETRFVLDHCGNADVRVSPEEQLRWERAIREIALLENVACKVSGFVWTVQDPDWSYEQTLAPILHVVLEAFGPDRILFGGDWPVCTLSRLTFAEWIAALQRFAETGGSTVARKLFYENAERIYGI